MLKQMFKEGETYEVNHGEISFSYQAKHTETSYSCGQLKKRASVLVTINLETVIVDGSRPKKLADITELWKNGVHLEIPISGLNEEQVRNAIATRGRGIIHKLLSRS